MRAPSFGTRWPPASEVSPWSPCRVYTRLIEMRGLSNGCSLIPLLPLRYLPLQPGYEIQPRRGVPKYLFIVPVERVAQAAVRRHAMAQRKIQVDPYISEARVPEQPAGGAIARLFVQRLAAEVTRRVGRDTTARVRRHDAAGVLRPPRQRVPHLKWRRRQSGVALERENPRPQQRVRSRHK